MVVQWLTLCFPNARALGSIPGQETKSHEPQLRVLILQLKKNNPHVTTNQDPPQLK